MKVIQYQDLLNKLKSILLRYKFSNKDADLCAQIFANNTLVGVASHGINRFSSFIKLINEGCIKVGSKPMLIKSFGALEQWDANLGPGPLNAWSATDRVMEIAGENGIGCVAYKNSNHWMRAGTYGWKAAEKGFILICWTNAYPMMPAWGSSEPTLGNNPMVLAVPRKSGHIVLDFALSQYSFGKLADYKREGKSLPFIGGYNGEGEFSADPSEVLDSRRPLPIGYWKGSGLSILLDLIAAILSGGKTSFELGFTEHDTGMSQVFIAVDPRKVQSADSINQIADKIILSIKKSTPLKEIDQILYPGERIKKTREINLRDGIRIDQKIWEKVEKL